MVINSIITNDQHQPITNSDNYVPFISDCSELNKDHLMYGTFPDGLLVDEIALFLKSHCITIEIEIVLGEQKYL
jgi:hypothetical protein